MFETAAKEMEERKRHIDRVFRLSDDSRVTPLRVRTVHQTGKTVYSSVIKAPESNICVSGQRIPTVSNTESAAADLPEQEGNCSAGWFHTLLQDYTLQ